MTSTPHPGGDPGPAGALCPRRRRKGHAISGTREARARSMAGKCAAAWCAAAGLRTACPCAGWDAVADLGVRTVFDLRAAHERIGQATGAVRVGVDVVQIPMWENGEPGTTLSDRVFSATGRTPEQSVAAYATAKVAAYVAMVTAYAPGFGALIEGLSAPGTLPAVMHCAAGKDRTGLAAAIVLRMLGVCEAGVLADYVRSREEYLRGPRGPVSAPTGTIGRFPRAVRPGLCRPPPGVARRSCRNDCRLGFGRGLSGRAGCSATGRGGVLAGAAPRLVTRWGRVSRRCGFCCRHRRRQGRGPR